ncbi:nicotinate (nicotinamide) nucleotide adenylyltransferase [Nitrosophilus kaiyonis]|uniref:nicotinate (nicotinamide) nucleotide adenylyltransferase n=1 Tax=Nitrosophilus kaiyonis TaxID=2930200 RepID=UPI00249253F0|nr:nicotinate (nicotinamide) nucleotide adenylyltransferase [Nitrosophilus kaiyonis]
MKIAVFGGSFDPIHLGHIKIIQEALKNLDIDKLIVVPTYLNPFKSKFAAPPKLRAKWLKIALFPYKKVDISLFEIKNQRPTYMIETIEYLKKKYHPTKIYLIIGADNIKDLHKWHNFKKLKNEVEFVVAKRSRIKVPSKYKVLNVNVPISATELRKKPIKKFLPKIVANEIIRFYEHCH